MAENLFELARLAIKDCLLSENEDDARDLWDIMTALRGPDHSTDGYEGMSTLKIFTTSRIRGAFLGNMAVCQVGADTNEKPWNAESSDALCKGDGHFQEHIMSARDTLVSRGLLRREL